MNAKSPHRDSNNDDPEECVNRLFLEADRLECVAYEILDAERDSETSWQAFTAAKALAHAKREQASQDLARVKSAKEK